MTEFFEFLSEGIAIQIPVWTEPYEDAFGFGRMMTAAMPVYETDINGIKKVAAVVGIDVLMNAMLRHGIPEKEVLAYTRNNQRELCFTSQLTKCQLQSLRGENNCGFDCANDSLMSDAGCEYKTEQIADQGETDNGGVCCGQTKEAEFVTNTVTPLVATLSIFLCAISFDSFVLYVLSMLHRISQRES